MLAIWKIWANEKIPCETAHEISRDEVGVEERMEGEPVGVVFFLGFDKGDLEGELDARRGKDEGDLKGKGVSCFLEEKKAGVLFVEKNVSLACVLVHHRECQNWTPVCNPVKVELETTRLSTFHSSRRA